MAEKPSGRKVSHLMNFFESTATAGCHEKYSHDVSAIKQSAIVLEHNSRNLEKLQDEIVRRTKHDKNGLIDFYRDKYGSCLFRMRQETKNLIFNLFDGNELPLIMWRTVDAVVNVSPRVDQEKVMPKDVDSTAEAWRQEVQRLHNIVERLTMQVKAETRAKEEALLRYSALAGTNLTAKDPTFSTLSDTGPLRVVELYNQVYDNEWTDAYDELESKMSGDEAIRMLRYILMCAFNSCVKITEPIRLYLDTDYTKICSEFRRMIINHLKQNADVVIPRVKEILLSGIFEKCGLTTPGPNVSSYIDACVQTCWLMVIQDPPMSLDNEIPEYFLKAKFRVYSKHGPHVAFIVWPALLRNKDGLVLAKGVAQGSDERGTN